MNQSEVAVEDITNVTWRMYLLYSDISRVSPTYLWTCILSHLQLELR